MKALNNELNIKIDKIAEKKILIKAVKENNFEKLNLLICKLNTTLTYKNKLLLIEEASINEKISLDIYKYLLQLLDNNQETKTVILHSFKNALSLNNFKIIKFILDKNFSYLSSDILNDSLGILFSDISSFDYQIYGVTFGKSLDLEKRKPATIEIMKKLKYLPQFVDKFIQDFIDKCSEEINIVKLSSR